METPPEKPVEAKVGDLVELFMGRGHVRVVREDGMLEVWAMGWEMAGEQIPRFYVRKDAVKVVPTVYYKMPGKGRTTETCNCNMYRSFDCKAISYIVGFHQSKMALFDWTFFRLDSCGPSYRRSSRF